MVTGLVKRLPFFYGWVIIAVAFVTMALGVNARTAFSLLLPPILTETGWDRGVTAGAFSFGFLVSAIIPYCYIVILGLGLLLMTLVSGSLQAVGTESIDFLGRNWSLSGASGALLYLLGVVGEIFVLTSTYLIMPVGRPSWRHALIGGITATVLWEITRHILVWYFGTLSQISVVYGSLTTSIAVLLSFELGATLLLLGAQVIAEYERIGTQSPDAAPQPLRT